jgi:hypothetical protein
VADGLAQDVELALEGVGIRDAGAGPMKTWRITGSMSLAAWARPLLSTGTSRQPSSTWPS